MGLVVSSLVFERRLTRRQMSGTETMDRVVAVMANWNGGEMAVRSAQSIVRQTLVPHLVVVDNASDDGSADAIAATCPGASIIRNRTNRGYAAANNQALRAVTDADYYLLVNNDIIFPDPGGLMTVVDRMRSDPSIRGACGRFEYPDGRPQRFYCGRPSPFIIAAEWGVLRHVPGILDSAPLRKFFVRSMNMDRPATVEQPAFACVLLRGDCARAVGLMDERFPIFFNDIDYCQRWRERRWTWHFFPDWRIVHVHSASVTKKPGLWEAEMLSSAARFAWKHYSRPTALAVHGALLLEAAWRKYRTGDLKVRLADIAHCRTFFCPEEEARRRSSRTQRGM
jgi:N-acetylglucosaminyl-diphospho-decaprenol L-rhamnosyltransferase